MPHPSHFFRLTCLAFALVWLLFTPLPARAGSAADSRSVPVDPTFFDYDASAPLAATETPLSETAGIRVSRVTYPSPVVTPFPPTTPSWRSCFCRPAPARTRP